MDADEQVKNSWSARGLESHLADADEVIKNSWSAKRIGNNGVNNEVRLLPTSFTTSWSIARFSFVEEIFVRFEML